MRVRAYGGPLTVLAAGTIGFSLFCIVAVVALAGADEAHPVDIQPQNIVDSAFSNLSTVAALTVEVIAEYIDTVTPMPTDTLSIQPAWSSTPTLMIPVTSNQATRTRNPREPFIPTRTPTRLPSATPVRTATPIPIPTTPIPTFTRTPEPTDTDVPPTPEDTSTPVPPTDTNTPQPDTPTPEPTIETTPTEETPTEPPIP